MEPIEQREKFELLTQITEENSGDIHIGHPALDALSPEYAKLRAKQTRLEAEKKVLRKKVRKNFGAYFGLMVVATALPSLIHLFQPLPIIVRLVLGLGGAIMVVKFIFFDRLVPAEREVESNQRQIDANIQLLLGHILEITDGSFVKDEETGNYFLEPEMHPLWNKR